MADIVRWQNYHGDAPGYEGGSPEGDNMTKTTINGVEIKEIRAVSYNGKKNVFHKYWAKGVDGIEHRITKEDAQRLQVVEGLNVKEMVRWDRETGTNIYKDIVIK